ncbi:hypothetical protein [Sulfurimonas sp. HSL3-7]|uniref:hypothetical protein n=1 Tax=Sulfonitrofixus jiaomeiensis TaxID=3131938 RepID=UPI0031F77607
MRFILLVLLPLSLFAQILAVGDRIAPRTLEDQFSKKHRVGNEKVWVLTWDKSTTRIANDYFEKDPSLLQNKEVAMIADFSTIPSGILSLFVMPRMQAYTRHSMLLSFDEKFNASLPYKEGCLTILYLEHGRIMKIEYVDNEQELASTLQTLFRE